jgi:DNA modification methylase
LQSEQQRVAEIETVLREFLESSKPFCLLHGDSESILETFPSNSVDCCLTSPPYWSQREYDSNSLLGAETDWREYVARLLRIFRKLKRIIKVDGSFWLNLGDTYMQKNLCGVPWRVAFALQDDGWILRNAVVWDKVKGNPDNAKDKLRNIHEYIFHFVKNMDYFYDVDSIRNAPGKPYIRNGRITTATGVSGARYEQQIRDSDLTPSQKREALQALSTALQKVEKGELPDFRMIIRGWQRATHSDSPQYSGRARELQARGYCILPYHKMGTKPGDVWHIIPEDSQREGPHYAVFPAELCELPIKATCRSGGILLDPFVGTGTAIVAAIKHGRRGIGIDTSQKYLEEARKRLGEISKTLF